MNAADRFTKRKLNLNYNTIEAIQNYFENGGTITVCKPGRRSKANTSFPVIKGTISYSGGKAQTLRKDGVVSRKKG